MDTSSPLYPPIEPYLTHQMDVGDGHLLYVEESGNPKGLPAIVLHGGPGSGCNPTHRQRFNPQVYRIICFDQRGCGRSTFADRFAANTTHHLIADIERIRAALDIPYWHITYGTSWGSTLALLYAQAFPQLVINLVVGGIFLANDDSVHWFSNPQGLGLFYPREMAAVVQYSKGKQGYEMFQAIEQAGSTAFQALAIYEAMASELMPIKGDIESYVSQTGFAGTALEVFYFARRCFLEENQILKQCPRIAHIHMVILQGQQDLLCPPAGAFALHDALPNSQLHLVSPCGHRSTPNIEALRVDVINKLA